VDGWITHDRATGVGVAGEPTAAVRESGDAATLGPLVRQQAASEIPVCLGSQGS
jgi:hypothetical protein